LAPVSFISVLIEGIVTLGKSDSPPEGRKGGSPVAAAILNALIVLAWEEEEEEAEELRGNAESSGGHCPPTVRQMTQFILLGLA